MKVPKLSSLRIKEDDKAKETKRGWRDHFKTYSPILDIPEDIRQQNK